MAARSRIPRTPERASAALDFLADHRADLSALVDAQFDGTVEAQFALDHAGRADVHFGFVVLAPSPVRSLVLPNCAARSREDGSAGAAISGSGARERHPAAHRLARVGPVWAESSATGRLSVQLGSQV